MIIALASGRSRGGISRTVQVVVISIAASHLTINYHDVGGTKKEKKRYFVMTSTKIYGWYICIMKMNACIQIPIIRRIDISTYVVLKKEQT